MPYRLVVADVDGTLLGEGRPISPAVLDAVGRLTERGVYFTVATGRTPEGAGPICRQLGANAPAILYQGTEIWDLDAGRPIYRSAIPLACAREFIATVAARDLHLNVYLDGRPYVARRTPEADFYSYVNRLDVHPVGDLLAFVDRDPTKMLIVAEPADLDALAPALQAQFAGRLRIVRSYSRFLEAIPADAHKGNGLAHLAGFLGVAQAETVAIGDNDNDAEMVAWAGLGVAMGNASPSVRATADVIAPSVEDDGVAWAIDTLVLPALAPAQQEPE